MGRNSDRERRDDVDRPSDEGYSLDLPDGMFRVGPVSKEIEINIHKRSREDNEILLNRRTVSYTEIDGLAIFEGDIILGTLEELKAAELQAAAGNQVTGKGIGIAGSRFRWRQGVMPYTVQSAVKPLVDRAIAHWEARTPIRFVPRNTHTNYVAFVYAEECSSRVGMRGGRQEIRLFDGCSVGSAIHEIGHALGLFHEQSRSDRDNFIEIVKANIRPGLEGQFAMHIQDALDLGPYDFGSIMHYSAKTFTANGLETIRVRGGQSIGQRDGLSSGDVASIKLLYPQLDWPD